jgi:hypothetical protein
VLPLLVGRLLVVEEELQEVDERLRVADVRVKRDPPVLHEDGPIGRLEDRVVRRVALVQLLLDLAVQVVVAVLGLPEAMGESVLVEQGSIDANATVLRAPFRNEFPAHLGATVGQEVAEGGADRPFVLRADALVGLELVVIVFDGVVGR